MRQPREMSDTPLTDAVVEESEYPPRSDAFYDMTQHARRLERALKVAEENIEALSESLRYAANRLDADGEQMQVAGDCAVAAATGFAALATIAKLKEGA